MIKLHLLVTPSALPLFTPLLEKGVVISGSTGCTLRNFLCTQLGIADDYLDQRIQTLFLNARPVDDVDKAVVTNGSTLALSAAMPGLLGATMRKGGRYAAFRKDISQEADACGICEAPGRVTVKMFNLVADEIGHQLFQTGVEISGDDLRRIAERHSGELIRAIRQADKNDQPISVDAAFFSTLSGQRLQFSVATD
jgi:hypothetical protein